jgi:hypothetical protein
LYATATQNSNLVNLVRNGKVIHVGRFLAAVKTMMALSAAKFRKSGLKGMK